MTATTAHLDQQPKPRHAKLCVALLVLMGFSLGCSEFMVIGIETELSDSLGVSLSAVGQLVSLFALPYAIMTPVLALTTGRFKRRSLLMVYCTVFVIGNLVSALSATFGWLVASRVAMGAISGALLALGTTYIPELVGTKRMGFVISVVYASYSVAMIVSTSAGKIVADTLNWHVAMWAVFVLALITSALLIAFMPRSGNTDEPATFGEQVQLLREPCIVLGMFIFVFGIGSVYVFYSFITPYLEQVLGMDTMSASATLMVYGAVCLISNLTGGWIDTRFGMSALPPIFIAIALVLTGISALNGAMPASLILVFMVALLTYGFSIACITLFMRIARQRHPKALTLATSIEPLSFNVGIAFGSAVAGVVIAHTSIINCGYVGAVLALVAAVLTVATIRAAKRI